MYRFQHNEFLFALMAIPLMLLLYFFAVKWKKRVSREIGEERLVKIISGNHSQKKYNLKFILILLAFSASVIALANLRSPQGTERVTRKGIDLLIALDVSKSMLARDIKPSRLERAKQLLGKLIDRLTNDRIGIVVFAGRAYLQMPLTSDHGAAKMYLSTASPDIVPTQGTVIADALQMCSSSFNSREKKYKTVLLISDGEDHDEDAVKVAGQMADEGIMVNTIGIGSPEGVAIIDETTNETKKDMNGNTVITKLNEDELKSIAVKGKGIYQLFTNTDEVVSKIENHLQTMDQRAVTEDSLVNYKNFFPYFLGFSLVLLVLELFIAERKTVARRWWGNTGKKRQVIAGICLCMFFPAPVSAQSENAIIKKGNEAYARKDYESASSSYRKAIEKRPGDAIPQYNLGNALFRNNKAEDAVAAYENAASNAMTAVDRSKSFYNKGVVLQTNKKLPECIDAYKNALKLNPGDEDARQNLQRALQQQKQKQQKEKQDKQPKKPKEEQKEKQKEEDKKNDPPKPQPSRISRQDAEEKLKALLQQEKNLQDKLKRANTATLSKPEKDW